MGRIKNAIEQHKAVRRFVLLWACVLVTWTVTQTFADPYKITGATATALATVVGILTTVIAFYKWQRFKEDRRDDKG